MICRRPDKCKEKARKRKLQLKTALSTAEDELSFFQKMLIVGNEEARFRLKLHAAHREMFRAYSRADITEAVKAGWPIDRQVVDGQIKIVMMHYLHTGPKTYRPIHVVCSLNSPLDWEIITVYDPRSKEWLWETDLATRKCWCD